MLSDYRAWLAAELALLGNASHHAYALGQANMAKRALERLDEAGGDERTTLALAPADVSAALTELALLAERGALPPGLAKLHDVLAATTT